MTTQHTPGPWIHYPDDNIISTNGGRKLLEWQARSQFVSTIERDANARLIAAAPELLAALKRAEEWLEGWASAEPYLLDIRTAIARATGAA